MCHYWQCPRLTHFTALPRAFPSPRLLVMWGLGSEQDHASPDDARPAVIRRMIAFFYLFHTVKFELDSLPERQRERARGSYDFAHRCLVAARQSAEL